MEKESSQFLLRLEGIKLPKEHEDRIGAALQKTLLNELASADLGGHVGVHIPKEWIGIWIERIRDFKIPRINVDIHP